MALGSLTKKQQQEFGNLLDAARSAVEKMKEVAEVDVDDADEAKAKLPTLNEAIENAQGACSDLASFCSSIYEEQQSTYDEKSERWQEGDRGQAVSSWIDEWSNVSEPSPPDVGEIVVEGDDFPTTLAEAFGIDLYELEEVVETAEGLPTETEF